MSGSNLRVRLIAGALLAGAVAVAWTTASGFSKHVGEADPGFVMYENGVVGPPWLSAGGAAFQVPGLRMMDRVVSVDGEPVDGGRAVQERVRAVGPGVALRYAFERPTGERYSVSVATRTFTEADLRALLLPFLLGGLMLLVVGATPILVRPEQGTARVFFLWSITWTTNFSLLPFDYFFTYTFMPWNYVLSWLAKASLLHVGLMFPVRRWPLTRWPRGALLVLYGVLALMSVAWVLAMQHAPWAMFILDKLAMGTFTLGMLLLTGNLAYTAARSQDVVQRQRARVVLAGPALATVAWCLLMATAWYWRDLGIPIGGHILIAWALPISVAYGILRHNLFEFNAVVRRAITAGAIALAGVLAYLAIFAGLQRLVGAGTAWAEAALSAAILLLLLPAIAPLRRRVEGLVEELLFPDHRRAHAAIHRASRELPRMREPAQVARLLRGAIRESVRSRAVRLLAGASDQPLRELAPEGAAVELGLGEPLRAAAVRGRTLNLDLHARPRVSETLRRQLEALDVRMAVPLPPTNEIIGLFLLGPRSDGRLYTSDDEAFVETLAAQSGVAIESARAWEEVAALQRRLTEENVRLRREIEWVEGFEEIVGRSDAIRALLAQVEQVAPTDVTVLVSGETGTGKELVVRALHRRSTRRERPLVKVACAAIPETLLESELFGHEKGAFTGATSSRSGRFELADGGTLLLDDVDTLPLGIQAKLLRAIQEGEVQRLGSAEPRRVDVRIVATTNRDLFSEVRAGRFREDLYYRLDVVPIAMPPLRERPDDIPLLVDHFARRQSARLGRPIRGVAEDTLAELCAYSWPGNVRELENAVERAVVMTQGDVLRLPAPLGHGEPSIATGPDGRPLAERVREFKTDVIARALEAAGGNQRRAAELLGLHPPSLSRMMRDLGIRPRAPGRPRPPGAPRGDRPVA